MSSTLYEGAVTISIKLDRAGVGGGGGGVNGYC